MRRIIFVLACLFLARDVSAAGKFLPCPESSIPDGLKHLPRWESDHMGTNPVIPELPSRIAAGEDPILLASKYWRGEILPTDSDEEKNRITRGYARLQMYLRIRVNAPLPGTLLDQVAPLTESEKAAFAEALKPENLELGVVKCGDVIEMLVSGAPDDKATGFPQILPLGMHVVAGYQEGVEMPNGIPGLQIVRMKQPVRVGDMEYNFFLFTHCGNPDELTVTLNLTTEAKPLPPVEPVPEPVAKLVEVPKAVFAIPPSAQLIPLVPIKPAVVTQPKRKICGKIGVLCWGPPLGAGVVYALLQGGSAAEPNKGAGTLSNGPGSRPE